MPRFSLPLFMTVALMLVLSYYLAPGSEESPAAEAVKNTVTKTYLVNTRSWNYSEVGALKAVLEADRATFYLAGGQTALESPRLYSHSLNNETWSASAKTGRYQSRRERLLLTDDVILTNDSKQVELKTEEMNINLQRNIARSAVPVTLTQGRNSTRADGLYADLERQIVRLRPNVESIYYPSERSLDPLR